MFCDVMNSYYLNTKELRTNHKLMLLFSILKHYHLNHGFPRNSLNSFMSQCYCYSSSNMHFQMGRIQVTYNIQTKEVVSEQKHVIS